jgi:hypothetical protein
MHQSALSDKIVKIDDISLDGDYDISPYPVHPPDDITVLH